MPENVMVYAPYDSEGKRMPLACPVEPVSYTHLAAPRAHRKFERRHPLFDPNPLFFFVCHFLFPP